MNRRPNSRLAAISALALCSAALFTGCSSSGSSDSASPTQPTANENFCAARTNVQTSFQTLLDSIQALNFGQAKDDATAAKAAIDDLAKAREDLKDETKAKVEDELDKIKSSLESVQDVKSLADAGVAIEVAKDSFNSALQTMGDAADCS